MTELPRYFKPEAKDLTARDPHKQLIASLTRLVKNHPPKTVSPGGGLYNGPMSIAYMLMALHLHYSDLIIEAHHLKTWSLAYLKEAEKYLDKYPGPSSSRCGIGNDVLALLALIAASSSDSKMAAKFCSYVSIVTDPNASHEWLYGQAGYLYLLRLVRSSFLDDQDTMKTINEAANEVIKAILKAQRPWFWHGKAYVGAVHGIIGIITQIVLTDPAYAPQLEGELQEVLEYQCECGNWPPSLPPGKDRLVQVCHGAPGVVLSLLSIRDYFPNSKKKIDTAIQRGQACIKERGFLTKEPCLCHGISGNALALEQADFEQYLAYTTGHEIEIMEKHGLLEKSDDPASLWCGEAGRAWAWAVADLNMRKGLLGYNDR